jgi:Carboxypeptidase regulatory-like domain
MKQLVTFALCSIFAFAQEPTETLCGIVTEPRGLVEGAPIQIRHVETGAVFRVISAPDGSFRFTGLPSGAYDVSVRFPVSPTARFSGRLPL